MTKLFKVALVSLVVVAGASAAQANSTGDGFWAEEFWQELERTGA